MLKSNHGIFAQGGGGGPPVTDITIIQHVQATGFSFAAITFTAPNTGDVIVVLHKGNESSGAGVSSTAAGYTGLIADTHLGVHVKVSDGTETQYNARSTSNADKGHVGQIFVLRNAIITGAQAVTNDTSNAPSLTPVAAGAMLICCGHTRTTIVGCPVTPIDASLTPGLCQQRGTSNFTQQWNGYILPLLNLNPTGTKNMNALALEATSVIIENI